MSGGVPALGLALALLAGAARAEADPLAAVRTALRQLTGTTPIAATLDRAVTSERKDRPREDGRAVLDVAARPDGISVAYRAELLDQLRTERAQTDPEQPQPARRTMENFDASDVADLLNGAVGLLSDLDGAVVKGDSTADYHGQPARRLDLELAPRVSKADSKWLKRASYSMRLWTDPDGVPLAAEADIAFRVGLLIFNFDAQESRTRVFRRVGDRLVTLRSTSRFDGAGLGESTHFRSETTLRLNAGS